MPAMEDRKEAAVKSGEPVVEIIRYTHPYTREQNLCHTVHVKLLHVVAIGPRAVWDLKWEKCC